MTGLARCVGDVPVFLDRHWCRSPLHRKAADGHGFVDLLSLDDVDRLISSSFLRLPAFRLVRDGTPLEPGSYTRSARLGGTTVSGVGDPRRIYEEFAEGATIVLQGLHRYWPALTRFCRDLELELTHPVQANAYITPPGSQGLSLHYDTHDVFVLQLAGHKQWAVHEPVLEDPLPSQPWSSTRGSPGEPCLSVDLRSGDSLYMPRGFLHSARAHEGVSAHLTIGVVAQTWHDVVRDLLADLADDVGFRRSLGAGFARDEHRLEADVADHLSRLREWIEKVDPGAVAAGVVRRFWSSRPPVLAGQLSQLLALDQLTGSSTVRRREGSVCRMTVVDGELDVLLGDRSLRMPAALHPAVARLAAGSVIEVSELADQLDEQSRLVLVRRLVREGLLEVVALG